MANDGNHIAISQTYRLQCTIGTNEAVLVEQRDLVGCAERILLSRDKVTILRDYRLSGSFVNYLTQTVHTFGR